MAQHGEHHNGVVMMHCTSKAGAHHGTYMHSLRVVVFAYLLQSASVHAYSCSCVSSWAGRDSLARASMK